MIRKGFTLIELVMVIVIIGVLAAAAIPKFINLQVEAKRAVCQSNVGAIRNALSNFYAKCNINVSAGGGCADGVPCNTTNCFPNATQLTAVGGAATTFSTSYFADGKLPLNNSITGTATDWSNANSYDPVTGVINMTYCCG
jgi:prepilin-type N-terminal cleavage/methylation domain-containing protein